jgi:hypothetical protein
MCFAKTRQPPREIRRSSKTYICICMYVCMYTTGCSTAVLCQPKNGRDSTGLWIVVMCLNVVKGHQKERGGSDRPTPVRNVDQTATGRPIIIKASC